MPNGATDAKKQRLGVWDYWDKKGKLDNYQYAPF
jgi:hypothetical protein